ncbi:DedA family protein [Methylosinus sp. Sm6]|uniref:DedA family protein n=1 Tax=Methylosinus sp. Sm6 TaxID=2866948 RepID=UPI001C99F9ED|nr:DedA family protein [Methylosinus sp. Sm6]MBY6243170.1 DedA family protein [Methylosinus sp. Sm6]
MAGLIDEAQIVAILTTYGYWAVFVVVALESAGIPLPGETMLVGAAIYAGHSGNVRIELIIAAAAAGAIIGDNIGFWIGREFGVSLLMRYGGHVGVGPPQLRLGQYLFMRWGGAIVFFGRFVALLRILAAVLAGANRFDPLKFLFYNAAGGICWSFLFGIGGYVFGIAITRIAGPIGWIGLAGAVFGVVALWRYWKINEERLMKEAEAHFARPERRR